MLGKIDSIVKNNKSSIESLKSADPSAVLKLNDILGIAGDVGCA